MKLILLMTLSLSISCDETLNKNGKICSLLREAFSSEYLQREFFLCRDGTSFILYDKQEVLRSCRFFDVCGKEIRISHDKKYDKLSPNDNHSTTDKSIVVLHKVEIEGEYYTLFFWRPFSGAAVNLTYRKSRDKFGLVDYSIGTF